MPSAQKTHVAAPLIQSSRLSRESQLRRSRRTLPQARDPSNEPHSYASMARITLCIATPGVATPRCPSVPEDTLSDPYGRTAELPILRSMAVAFDVSRSRRDADAEMRRGAGSGDRPGCAVAATADPKFRTTARRYDPMQSREAAIRVGLQIASACCVDHRPALREEKPWEGLG